MSDNIIQFNAQEQEKIEIEPAHLINALKCIDTAAQRGAFYGGEMSPVGRVRDAIFAKVSPILEQLEKERKAKEESAGTTQPAAE